MKTNEIAIATCGCLLLMVGWGLTYAMPVIFPFVAQHFAIPGWHLTAYFSIGGAIIFGIGGWSGAIADRHGTPVIATFGLLIAAGGFTLASLAHSEWVFAIGYIFGVGAAAGLVYVPVTAAVQVLTERKIITAGITSSGIGFGSMLLPPLIAWCVHLKDYHVALLMMAGIAVIGILPVVALRGMEKRAPPPTGVSALHTNPKFVWAFVGQVLFAIMVYVPFAHLVSIALWRGWRSTEGVELISLLGLFSTLGRFLVAPFAQRMGACHTACFCALLSAVSMVGIAFIDSPHWVVWSSIALFGITYGGVIALSAPVAAEICGGVDVGRNVGTLTSARAVGVLVGPSSVGVTEWWMQSYTAPLLTCAAIGCIAAFCLERSGWRTDQLPSAVENTLSDPVEVDS